MDFEKINYLKVILEEKSITKASKKLYISQPALSKFVSKLEEEIGLKIFKRETNGLQLTPAGELFYKKIQEIHRIHEELQNEIGNIKSGKVKKIKIGIVLNRSPYILPGLLKYLNGKYKDLRIEIYENKSFELEEMLIREQIDFAILPLPIKHSKLLDEKVIYTENILLIAPPEKNIETINNNIFENEEVILLKKQQHLRLMIDTYFKKKMITPKIKIETDNLECLLTLVEEGLGIGFASSTILEDKKWKDKFSVFHIDEEFLKREYGLIFKKDKNLNLVEKSILEYFSNKRKI